MTSASALRGKEVVKNNPKQLPGFMYGWPLKVLRGLQDEPPLPFVDFCSCTATAAQSTALTLQRVGDAAHDPRRRVSAAATAAPIPF